MATKQTTKGKEIIEDNDDVIFDKFRDSEAFFQKNKKTFLYVGGAILLAVGGFFFYKYQQNESNTAAQAGMYNAVMAWEKDSLKQALEGNPKKDELGLIDVAENNSGTDAANLANYYAGVAFLKQGKFEDAIEKLKDFKASDLILQGQAYCLIGDAYLELKDLDNASEYYAKASNYKPNEGFTPTYLMKLAMVQELQKNYDGAIESYDRIINQYSKSKAFTDAKKYRAKVEGLTGQTKN